MSEQVDIAYVLRHLDEARELLVSNQSFDAAMACRMARDLIRERLKPAEARETVPPQGSLEAATAAVAEARDGLATIQSACAELGMPLPPLPMTPRERFEKKHPALEHLRKSRPESMSPELVRACLMELLHSVAYLVVEASDKAVVEAQVEQPDG